MDRQNWRSYSISCRVQTAILTGDMGGFCLHEKRDYEVIW